MQWKSAQSYSSKADCVSRMLWAASAIGLYHPLDGVTTHKYKLLHFLTAKYFLQRQEDASF